jgi:hypothetical protein
LAFFALILLGTSSMASAQELRRSVWATPPSLTQAHIWVAKRRAVQNIWRRCRSDLSARRRRDQQALVAGDPPMVNVGTTIQATLAGYDLVLIASMENNFTS